MDERDARADSRVVLLDNGSVNPDSVLAGRKLAADFAEGIGASVDLVSVAHSDRIPAEELDGVPAQIWEDYLANSADGGIRELRVVPLFFGPSFALRKAKKAAAALERHGQGLLVRWSDCLVSVDGEDDILTEILADNTLQVVNAMDSGEPLPRILMIDHGSPFPEVTEIRDLSGTRLAEALGQGVEKVVACSMERREGEAYDFNEPTLESAIENAKGEGVERLILSYLFLFPGRHAGPGGDIDQICQAQGWGGPSSGLLKTILVGESPRLPELLQARLGALK